MDLWALLVVAVLLLAVGDVLLWRILHQQQQQTRVLWALQAEVGELGRWAMDEPDLSGGVE